jgi:hypothetical protein
MMALSGCSQQEGQAQEESATDTASSETDTASSELSIEEFRIEDEPPDEYETEFLRGSTPEQVADELQPELSYRLAGAQGQVETEVQFEYSDRTIPEGEPLNETVEGDTHEGNGEYTQTPGLPDGIAEEMLENPKNLHVTFKATDTESGETKTEEFELNLADSYIEAAYQSQFTSGDYATTDAKLENIEAADGTITISYRSQNEISSQEFKNEIGGIAGGYSEGVTRTRVPYELEVSVEDSKGEKFEKDVSNKNAEKHLNGELTRRQLSSTTVWNELLED